MQEPAHKLKSREGHHFLSPITRVFPLKGDLAVSHGKDSPVADRHPMDVSTQIADEMLDLSRGRLGVNNPVLFQNLGGNIDIRKDSAGRFQKHAAKELGERLHGHEKPFSGISPEEAFHATGRDNAMDVWVIFQG